MERNARSEIKSKAQSKKRKFKELNKVLYGTSFDHHDLHETNQNIDIIFLLQFRPNYQLQNKVSREMLDIHL
ncbi:CLUMA_CG019249, isoform A [Clunio marinus]|uniref:CLUMA_CG019249, isoform A n=1 Tax=Clunio marinus TaxID=568069 RepID=A0A1J1J2B8_9DIPT|nr:CLUMA_CG019249, isoform A [Clunio marinus]